MNPGMDAGIDGFAGGTVLLLVNPAAGAATTPG